MLPDTILAALFFCTIYLMCGNEGVTPPSLYVRFGVSIVRRILADSGTEIYISIIFSQKMKISFIFQIHFIIVYNLCHRKSYLSVNF